MLCDYSISTLGGLILNSYYMEWPKEYLLFSARLPLALAGGHMVLELGVSSFISDLTSAKERTLRLFCLNSDFNIFYSREQL